MLILARQQGHGNWKQSEVTNCGSAPKLSVGGFKPGPPTPLQMPDIKTWFSPTSISRNQIPTRSLSSKPTYLILSPSLVFSSHLNLFHSTASPVTSLERDVFYGKLSKLTKSQKTVVHAYPLSIEYQNLNKKTIHFLRMNFPQRGFQQHVRQA